MHELITSVASILIMSLFVMQFAMSENLYLELSACEKVISDYEKSAERDQAGRRTDLERIPNVSAEVRGEKVELTIDNIIVPIWNDGDNQIKIIKELRHEEPYDDPGNSHIDESASEGS